MCNPPTVLNVHSPSEELRLQLLERFCSFGFGKSSLILPSPVFLSHVLLYKSKNSFQAVETLSLKFLVGSVWQKLLGFSTDCIDFIKCTKKPVKACKASPHFSFQISYWFRFINRNTTCVVPSSWDEERRKRLPAILMCSVQPFNELFYFQM